MLFLYEEKCKNVIYYDTYFYEVVRCNVNQDNENLESLNDFFGRGNILK